MDDGVQKLAELLRQRAVIDDQIAKVIGYPAHPGHIGEYIASNVFDIELNHYANQRASDGHFRSGPLVGKTVNIKLYSVFQGYLDIASSESLDDHPNYYLVMTGSRSLAGSSRMTSSPISIAEVYLFEAAALIPALISNGVRRGIATSVRAAYWREAMIYPESNVEAYVLTPDQRTTISSFTLRSQD